MIEFASPALLPKLKALWKLVFADSNQYIDLFFARQYRGNETLIDTDNGAVRAMLFFPRYSFRIGKRLVPAGYICGAATHPDHRKKGIMAGLIERAHIEMSLRGDEYSMLIPADESLYSYYSRFGYSPFFRRGTAKRVKEDLSYLDTSGITLFPADDKTLFTLYNELSFDWQPAVLQDKQRLSMLLRFFPGRQPLAKEGQAYILHRFNKPLAYMFCSYEEDKKGSRLNIHELSGDIGIDTAAAVLLRERHVSNIIIEGPLWGRPHFEKHRNAGMLKPLKPQNAPASLYGYMNMMLD